MYSLHKSIQNVFLKGNRAKKYFVILQGPRGSGKTFFAHELKQFFDTHTEKTPNFQIVSIDDYCDGSQSLANAYKSCKQNIKTILSNGASVIYNNTNLEESQIYDVVDFARNLTNKVHIFIVRFFPSWTEEKSVEIVKYFHPTTQQNASKQTIIRDNIVLFSFKNKINLPIFGICSNIIENKMYFTQTSPQNLILKKKEYVDVGYYREQIIPKTPKNTIVAPKNINCFVELCNKNKEIESLKEQLDFLTEQLQNLTVGVRTTNRRPRQL